MQSLNTKITRRSFLMGSAAVLSAAGLGLSACGSSTKTQSEDTITAALAYQSTNSNPIGNSSALFCAAGWHVFEGLYDFNYYDYSTFNGLAAAKPQKISALQYRVALREGAKFSNGEAVLASDVVNAFNRNQKDELYKDFLSGIKSLTAVDDKTILIDLNFAFDELLEKRLTVVKVFPASMSDADLKKMPIGSGPWMYESIEGNDGGKLSFVPNPYYNGTRPAAAKRMEWNVLLDNTSRVTALCEQSVMACEDVPVSNVDLVKSSGGSVEALQSVSLPFFCFNCLKKPFDDYRVRQAFFYAIDVEKLIYNQMNCYGEPASCILPKGHPSYHEASDVFTYDPDKARQLLSDAGCTSIDMTLLINNTWVYQLANQIKYDLEKVGINCELDKQTIVWGRYAPSDDILPFDVMLAPGDPSCFGNDADLIMSWWYGDNLWMKGRSCYKKSKNNRFDELQQLMQKARETSGAEMQNYLNQCYDVIAQQCPIYPIFHRQMLTGYFTEKLKDFNPISTTGLNFIGSSVAEKSVEQ